MTQPPRSPAPRLYSAQFMPAHQTKEGVSHWRVADPEDNRIATCYDGANARDIVDALNRRAAASGGEREAWAILFEDADVKPELFIGDNAEQVARKVFADRKLNWTCHLMCSAALRASGERAGEVTPHPDSVRLDWLETWLREDPTRNHLTFDKSAMEFTLFRLHEDRPRMGMKQAVREAIDSAMQDGQETP